MWDAGPNSASTLDSQHVARGHFSLPTSHFTRHKAHVTPSAGPEQGWDADPKTYGWDGLNAMMWRWLCATGVYHAAANTLTVEQMYKKVFGVQGVQLCKRADLIFTRGGFQNIFTSSFLR